MKTLGLVVPCYNEQDVIRLFYDEVTKVISSLNASYSCELVFVDDGSTDKTLPILQTLAQMDPSVKYISFSRNFGKEAAMLAGMKYAVKFDYIGILDADLQHSPSLLVDMLRYVDEEGYDVAAAKRVDREGESRLKSSLSNTFYKISNKVSEVNISDSAQDFRIMRKKVVEAVLEMPEKIRFSKGIFSWVGFNVKWIEHENRERAAGQTKWSIKKLFRYAVDGILGYTNMPLKLSFVCGGLFFLLTLVLLIYALVKYLILLDYNATLPLILSAMFFIGGVLLMFLGILGEYLARVYTETKSRPVYIISQTNTIPDYTIPDYLKGE